MNRQGTPIQKQQHLQAKEEVQKIKQRATHLNRCLQLLYNFIEHTQQCYSSQCKRIFKDITSFEQKISKASFYSTQKTKQILGLAMQYRQTPSFIEALADINLNHLMKLNKFQQLKGLECKLNTASNTFYNEFKDYQKSIFDYNYTFQQYSTYCEELDEIIQKFKSYNDPLKFYNKTITSEYQQKLQKSLNQSQNQQTKLKTEIQLLDNKRVSLDQGLKNIRQAYTVLFHSCLKIIQKITKLLADTQKEENIKNLKISLGSNEKNASHSETYQLQFQRLNTFNAIGGEEHSILSDFGDILKNGKNSKKYHQLVNDHKFFSDRCQNLKIKKQKAFNETITLQATLIDLLTKQTLKFKEFDRDYKNGQKKIFSLTSKESFKKDFQLFFGDAAAAMLDISLTIIQTPKLCMSRIVNWIIENLDSFKFLIDIKKEALDRFNKAFNQIIQEHIQIKQKYESKHGKDEDIRQQYQTNIAQSLEKFKLIFTQIQSRQQQADSQIIEKLIHIHKYIGKQQNACKISTMLQTKKQSVAIMNQFNMISQSMEILSKDNLYNILFEEIFNVNLQKKFQTKINQSQFERAEIILKQKQQIAKKMLKRQVGCCGLVTARPINNQIISEFQCSIYNPEKNHPFGHIKILKEGLTFEEKNYNPFKAKIHILIPNSDIKSVQSKALSRATNMGEAVTVQTLKGSIIFITSKNFDNMFADLQKNYGQTYRKSIAMDKTLAGGKNTSTQSSFSKHYQKNKSVMVSYNKQSGTYSQEVVVQNGLLAQMNDSGSYDKKLKGSGPLQTSSITGSQLKPIAKSNLNKKQKAKNLESLKQIMKHYIKRHFLPNQFTYVQKQYKSIERKDYNFKDQQTHNKFLLKELKKHQFSESIEGTVLQIIYEWKISFANNMNMPSFKHGQKIVINLNLDPPIIIIVQWPHLKEQIYTRHSFYQKIKEMNKNIAHYMAKNTGKQFILQNNLERQYNPLDDTNEIVPDDLREGTYTQEFEPLGAKRGYPNSLVHKSTIYGSMAGQGILKADRKTSVTSNINSETDKKFLSEPVDL